MDQSPDFFMSTAGEYGPLAAPRACWARVRLRDESRDDYMLIDIEPALDGQRFGLGAIDITQLIICTRHTGQTLYPISEWPAFVYITRALDKSIFETLAFIGAQVELIAWGMLFRAQEDALDFAKKFQK